MRHLVLPLCVAFGLSASSLDAQEFLGKTADGWAAQLKANEPKERRSAAFALGKMGNRANSVVKNMKAAYVAEKDVKVREAIVYALGEIARATVSPDPSLEQLFIGAINDENKYLRRSAAFALGCLSSKSPATRKALESALGDGEAIVRQNAAFALAQFKEDALPALAKALRDDDSLVKRDAASVMGRMADGDKVHEYLDDVLPLCRDKNSETRRAALNILAQIVDVDDKKAIEPLRGALADSDLDNRRSAALALCKIGGEAAVAALPVLLDAARSGDVEFRQQALLAISTVGKDAKSAVPDLVLFLRDDKDAGIRKNAAVALGRIGKSSEPAVRLLADKLADTSETAEVRFECAMALGSIGPVPASRALVPALLGVLTNTKDTIQVRERVMWALRVHRQSLKDMPGTRDAFRKTMNEKLFGTDETPSNRMLRYDSAYMLGMIWADEAPDDTLDRLLEFLHDKKIKVYDRTDVRAGSGGLESKGEKGGIKELGKGDGRVMAADALLSMGAARYRGRADIMKQLKAMNDDPNLYPPLQKKVVMLLSQ